MSDEVLIDKVVERGLFEDLAKVAAHYGIAPVRRAVTAFTARNRAAGAEPHAGQHRKGAACRSSPLTHAGEGQGGE